MQLPDKFMFNQTTRYLKLAVDRSAKGELRADKRVHILSLNIFILYVFHVSFVHFLAKSSSWTEVG